MREALGVEALADTTTAEPASRLAEDRLDVGRRRRPQWIDHRIAECAGGRRATGGVARLFEATTIGVARAKWPHAARRPVSLLSGLLTCGCCGGRYGLVLRDRFGCLNHHRRGTCANARTIRREKIEQRVLSGLTDRLVSAEFISIGSGGRRTRPIGGSGTRSSGPPPAFSPPSKTACISRP